METRKSQASAPVQIFSQPSLLWNSYPFDSWLSNSLIVFRSLDRVVCELFLYWRILTMYTTYLEILFPPSYSFECHPPHRRRRLAIEIRFALFSSLCVAWFGQVKQSVSRLVGEPSSWDQHSSQPSAVYIQLMN